MSDSKPTTPGDDLQDAALRERLVAYLDRELPHRESEQIEHEIAHDESARSTLEGLDRVWRALDVLPVEKTEADFTRTTLALATQASLSGNADGLLSSAARPLWNRARWLTPAASALAAFVIAWAAFWLPERRTLDKLPIALASDALKQIDDLDFLRRLAERSPELDRAAADPAIISEAAEWLAVDRMKLAERRDWVQGLEEERRQEVARRVASFNAAGAAAQPIADRHAELLASTGVETLTRHAAAYGAYAASLSTGDQAELRTADAEQRLRRVAKDLRRWRIERSLEITADERSEIADHLYRVAGSALIERIAQQIESARGRRPGPISYADMIRKKVKSAPATVFARMGAAYRRSNDGRRPRNARDALARYFGREFSRSWPEIEQAIVSGLPTRLAAVFEDEDLNENARTDALVRVLEQVAGGDTPSDLGEAFESLNSSQQIRYLGMPAEEMLERLDEDWAKQAGFAEPALSDRESPFRPPFAPPGVRPPDRPPRDRGGPRPPRPR